MLRLVWWYTVRYTGRPIGRNSRIHEHNIGLNKRDSHYRRILLFSGIRKAVFVDSLRRVKATTKVGKDVVKSAKPYLIQS